MKVSMMFSGHQQFMKDNMTLFDRAGVDVVSVNDTAKDINGNELREVTVVCSPEDANQIMQDLSDKDLDSGSDAVQFGGVVTL